VLLLSFLLKGDVLNAQLVNIESKRMQTDSTRFVFRGDVSSSYTNNNGDYLFQLQSNISTQLKSKDLNKILFVVGDYSLITSENQDFQNAWFLHLRYNHEITNLFRFEAFIQGQNNKILDINTRNLAGLGIRLKAISKNNLRLYWGNAYMYEVEKSDELNTELFNHRYSSYLSFSAGEEDSSFSLTNTIYYQPLLRDFDDYRILDQLKINYALSKRISFFILLDYYYDSITPRDRSQYSTTTSAGLGIEF
jgi:hypothetical protein